MKKVLVLLLVLGLASAASALPTLSGPTTASPGDTITITAVGVAGDQCAGVVVLDSAIYGYYGDSTALGTIGNISGPLGTPIRMGDPLLAIAASDGYYGVTFTASGGTAGPSLVLDGNWFTFDVTIDAGHDFDVDGAILVDVLLGGVYTLDSSHVITPEPMTMALLGLGGLFLRRRK